MASREISADEIYRSPGQRFARFLHLNKARMRRKERTRVQWLGQFIPRGSVVVDIGAHFGYFTKEFARLHEGTCAVHAFEPLPYNFGILSSVTSKLDNVQVMNYALSDVQGIAELLVPVKSQGKIGPGLAHFGEENKRDYIRESVETVRLDDLVRAGAPGKVDFIKCDVEGAELLAFKGAEDSIGEFRPTVYCEINADYTKRLGYAPGELFDYFEQFGYRAHFVDSNDTRFSLRPVGGYHAPGDYLLEA